MPPFSFIVILLIAFILLCMKNRKQKYIYLLTLYCFLDMAWLQGCFISGIEKISFAALIGL